MPTTPKPPPQHEVEQLLLGLFGWLRNGGHTAARVPGRAKREILSALRERRLDARAKNIAAAFLVALDTWLYVAGSDVRRQAPQAQAALDEWREDGDQRDEAIEILRAFPTSRLAAAIERIADADAKRAELRGLSPAGQRKMRERWITQSDLLVALHEALERKLRAPLGVPFPRTLKEWNRFERGLIDRLHASGLSYGEITRLCRPEARASANTGKRYHAERERIRGSARRARARKG